MGIGVLRSLASLWRSADSTAEEAFVCSAVFVAPGKLLTARHAVPTQAGEVLFVRPAADATVAYPAVLLSAHDSLDAAVLGIEHMPANAEYLPLLLDGSSDPTAQAYTLNGYFEGRIESPSVLSILSFDPVSRWYLSTPRQPKGHSGSAVCLGSRLWGIAVEHYQAASVDRGCIVALHQLWVGWLDGLVPAAIPVPPGRQLEASPMPAVETATAFVGETERGGTEPRVITSWAGYREHFGEPLPPDRTFLGLAVRGYFDNGGTQAVIARALSAQARPAQIRVACGHPSQALIIEARDRGEFGNRLRVVVEPGARVGVRILVAVAGAPAEQATQEDFDNLAVDPNGANPLLDVLNGRSRWVTARWLDSGSGGALPEAGHWPLAGGVDPMPSAEELLGDDAADEGHGVGLARILRDGEAHTACLPDLVHPRFSATVQTTLTESLVALAERHRTFVLLSLQQELAASVLAQAPVASSWGAVYCPWIDVPGPDGQGVHRIPPVGHLAGALCRHDMAKGVHRQPVGLVLQGLSPVQADRHLELSADADRIDRLKRRGINSLCLDAARGHLVTTTAVTMAIDEGWQQIGSARFEPWLVRSIWRQLMWVAFEPLAWATCHEVCHQLTELFCVLWQRGVLAGELAEHAFFVRCGESTMSELDLDEGVLRIDYGYILSGDEQRMSRRSLGMRGAPRDERKAR